MDKLWGDGMGVTEAAMVVGAALILLLMYWERILRYLKINAAFWRIPGPFAYPIIGNAHMFLGGPRDFFRVIVESRDRYGAMFRLWIGRRATLFLCGAEEVQPLLSSSVHIQKSEEYKIISSWLGTGLITSGGSKWHRRRKMLTGAFHNTLLEGYVESLDKGTMKMVNVLMSRIPKESPKEWSEEINVCPLTKLTALDATCETIMGYQINALENSNQEYINSIERVNKLLQTRFITPWLKPDFIFFRTSYGKEYNQKLEIINKFVDQVIRERKEAYAAFQKEGSQKESTNGEDRPKRKSFLDLLLDLSDNGKVLSGSDIREEVNTFMFAGHDTTSGTMNWCLYKLGRHPETQTRILEEAGAILGKDGNANLTLSQINKMDYLDQFIREVLRMYPPVPLIGRELESPLTIKGVTLPAGTSICISTYTLHRDPTNFPNPEKFDPNRFLPSEMSKWHSFAYTPFSAGPRNCIGQKLGLLELKIFILRLIQNLEVKSLRKEEDIILQGEIVLTCPDGVPISFRKRL